MKIEKRIELFVENCIKYLSGLYDLKRIVPGKNFEKYNAQFKRSLIIFFLEGRYGSNRIVHDWNFLKVFEVVKGYKPE